MDYIQGHKANEGGEEEFGNRYIQDRRWYIDEPVRKDGSDPEEEKVVN